MDRRDGATVAVVESQALSEFVAVMGAGPPPSVPRAAARAAAPAGRLSLAQDDAKNGLARLVLALIKLLHELLERQALRRIEAGSLTGAEIERLGLTLMRQAQELDRVRRAFNLEDEDLNLDLGPLGTLL